MLSILMLLALAVGCVAAYSGTFGGWSRYVQAVCFTTTLPLSKPLLPNAEAPELQAIAGALLLILVVGLVLQLRWLRGQAAAAPLAAAPAA